MDTIHTKTTKESLIADIKRRQEDKIIEESNAKLLIKLIENAEDLNEAINIAALGTTYKRTGFHFDKRLEKMGNDIKYFKKNEKLSFVGESTKSPITHKLIIGDNYDALQNLLIEYKGKIDVIYIDPPYGKDSMGEFAETNYDNAITRDNLLSMLYNRLILAKELMSDDGVIFCSIDDRNQAYVKGLFDEVFLENNFVSCLIWHNNKKGRQMDKYIKNTNEYIYVYAKNIEMVNINLKKVEVNDEEYTMKDEISKFKKGYPLHNGTAAFFIDNRPNLCYTIYYNPKTKDAKVIDEKSKNDNRWVLCKSNEGEKLEKKGYVRILPKINQKYNRQRVWRWGRDKFLNEYQSELMFIKEEDNNYYIYQKERLNDDGTSEQKYTNYIDIDTSKGRNNLNELFNNNIVFDFPKPVDLMKYLIEMTMKHRTSETNILDFFAGSGTTGQAVLELNKEDDGNRQFILCTNNEKTETTPNGIVIDVTSKRLKRVMTGKCYDATSDFDWIKKNESLGGSLDVYDIAQVFNYERSTGKSAFDVIDETLYGKEKFTDANDKIKWVCENFEHTQKYLEEK